MPHNKKQAGFTLVEILVVITVIALLAAGITPVILGMIKQGRVSRMIGDVRQLETALQRAHADTGYFPQLPSAAGGDPGLADQAIIAGQNAAIAQLWRGPYMKNWPTKHPYAVAVAFDYHYNNISAAGPGSGQCASRAGWNLDGIAGNTVCIQVRGLPPEVKLEIDNVLDDGSLATGRVQDENASSPNSNIVVYVGEGTRW